MSTYVPRSEQDYPFFVLSEGLPDSHSTSSSPFFVRTIETAINEDSYSSSNSFNAREIGKRDAGLDTNIPGVVLPLLLGVVQLGFQAKGNHIALASLQLAQAVAASGQAHRVVDAAGAGAMTAASVVGTAASGISLVGANTVASSVSALQQHAGRAYRWALPSLPNHLATLNPFNRSRSSHTSDQNTDDAEDSPTDRASDLVDDRFAVGSDYSEDEIDHLDGIQIEGVNPWAEERGLQTTDNFQA